MKSPNLFLRLCLVFALQELFILRSLAVDPGDVSNDGMFNEADVILLQDYLAGKRTFTTNDSARANVNGDFVTDVADLVWMVNRLGTITIDATPDTGSWTLVGPAGFEPIDGTGDRLGGNRIRNAPVGTYTLSCHDNVTGYDPPSGQSFTFTLRGSHQFTANWVSENTSVPVEMIDIPTGAFIMGRTDEGDDLLYAGNGNELPRHQVTLSAYQIGKYEVTVGDYCKMLNSIKGHLSGSLILHYDMNYAMTKISSPYDDGILNAVFYYNGVFYPSVKAGAGGIRYSLDNYPMFNMTWYGAIIYCNWLSERNGLTPCYDLTTMRPITPIPNGYRLPTEAEWERAAAWDGQKHWVYGFMKDELQGYSRCSYYINRAFCDPFGFSEYEHFRGSPVGWYDGINISPTSGETTYSVSPVGCYDMSGNLEEWCQDWYAFYPGGAVTDPTGPAAGSLKILRGGSWSQPKLECRTAYRHTLKPNTFSESFGFRVARYK